ncbi:MAG TPA: hypothetical protein DCY13_02800 [Verrucomicrobiales bacterium]|nr:hypothetical protein [Verrucomicrobiales bacterium]
MENQQVNRIMTVGDWMFTLLVLALPLVNLIMLLVWAFSRGATSAAATTGGPRCSGSSSCWRSPSWRSW